MDIPTKSRLCNPTFLLLFFQAADLFTYFTDVTGHIVTILRVYLTCKHKQFVHRSSVSQLVLPTTLSQKKEQRDRK